MQSSTGKQRKLLPMKKHTITAREQLKITIKKQIILIYFESKQRYGSPRITIELQSLGYKISRRDR